jgi:ribosomal protein L29
VEPLLALAAQITELRKGGSEALAAYVRNLKVELFGKAEQAFVEVQR